MQRINEMKSIMRKLKDTKNESLSADIKNESLNDSKCEEVETDNDTSDGDLLLAKLDDLISRLENALSLAEDDDKSPAEDEGNSDEGNSDEGNSDEDNADENNDDEDKSDEDNADNTEESLNRSLEERLAALERRFTESRRRNLVKRFMR
jgi:hypothetical protein